MNHLRLVLEDTLPGEGVRASAAGLSPGMVIAGKYVLSRYLARGGMAEVWLATHAALKSDVALKVVDPRLTSDASTAPFALERFRFEAQISARLASLTRNVVAAHDAGLHEGLPYLVMEYVPGSTLEDEIEARGPIAPERMADILDQAADALEAARSIGVVHRDLKPSNIMLTAGPEGRTLVKIADFGVAKALTRDLPLDRPRETAVGELVGTPAFMSPEQIRGLTTVDARSDVWSLAAATYEALTRRPPFDGDTLSDLMVAILSKAPTPPSRARPGLPRALDAWFERALAKAAADRFATAREAADAFREAVAAPPRRRMGAILAASVLAIAAGVLVLAVVGARRRSVEPPPPAPIAAVVTAEPSAPPEVPPPIVAPVATAEPADRRAPPPRAPRAPDPKHPAPPPPAAPTAKPEAPPPPPPPPPPAEPPPAKKRIDPSEIQ